MGEKQIKIHFTVENRRDNIVGWKSFLKNPERNFSAFAAFFLHNQLPVDLRPLSPLKLLRKLFFAERFFFY